MWLKSELRAALAGLLFVSLSVNEERILQFPGLPERALQAFCSLFLVFALASLALAPDHAPRSFGAGALAAALAQAAVLACLQFRSFQPGESHSRRALGTFLLGQAASWAFVIGSTFVVVRGDWSGLAWYPAGVILAFGFAGAVSWVLMIEIQR